MTPAAKIGLLMLAGLVILGIFIIKIEDIPVGERGERLVVEATLPSAAGIDRKAPVRVAGVRVGKVEDIALDGSRARIVMSLDPRVRLHEGATAQVTSLGMLGDRYVEILPGDPSAPLIVSGATLPGATAPTFEDVMRAASDIGGDLKEVSAALRSSLGGQQGAESIEEIVDNIRELTASLKVLIEDNQANVNATTANFRDFSATLRDELPRIADKMNLLADQLSTVVSDNRDNVQASLVNIRDLSDRLRTTADNLNSITGTIARGEGTIGKLVNDETTVDNLNQTLDSIDGGVQTLQDSLGRMQRFRLDVGLRTEGLPNVSESRTSFGFDLWTTDKRFFRVEGVDLPFGRTTVTTEEITTEWQDGTSETYTVTNVKTEDKIAINAQVGYRLFPDTLVRAGLIETTGGVGIDHFLLVLDRPLQLTLEAYDFGRRIDDSVHVRLESRYYLTRHLFVMAGWDDPLFSERSSVLVGAGVKWTDEDLKYSLGLAGSAIR
jgi:phospholipid/cholesterol/gamma-HCH transport system substrate-binding protein